VPVLTEAERTAPLESWTEREARLTRDRVAAMAAKAALDAAEFDARLARARAWGCDDGDGSCLHCGVPLGTDASGAQTHVDNGCPGPARSCHECGTPWTYDGKRWMPACSPAEHEARARAATWALATKTHNPLSAPPRAYKDSDND
jgi:hypothetical protein